MPELVKQQSAKPAVDSRRDHEITPSQFAEDFHAPRMFSVATGVVGVLHAAAASTHTIGLGRAVATARLRHRLASRSARPSR
ncbi:MAG: hypothetical protein FJ095_08150 [Deltaproteobacteria bacterium]|nr:hypothetical protein [Deltaproteobacteria bacterium]